MSTALSYLTGIFVVVLVVSASRSVAVSQIALGLLVLVHAVRTVRGERTLPRLGVEWIAVAFFAWAVVLAPFSADPADSFEHLKRFYLFTAMWVVAAAARDETGRRTVTWALVGGAVLFTVVGGLDHFVDDGRRVFADRLEIVTNAMTTGALLMLPAVVGLAIVSSCRLGLRTRLAMGVSTFVVVAGLALTMTRSALLGFLAGAIVVAGLRSTRAGVTFAVVVLIMGSLVVTVGDQLLPGDLGRRFAVTEFSEDGNVSARLRMWEAGLRMIRERPLFGFGDASTAELTAPYYDPSVGRSFGHLHSNSVQIAVIWGLPGLALYLAFLWGQVRALATRRARDDRPWADALRIAARASVVAFFVAGLTEWYFGDAESLLMAMIVYGLGAAPEENEA